MFFKSSLLNVVIHFSFDASRADLYRHKKDSYDYRGGSLGPLLVFLAEYYLVTKLTGARPTFFPQVCGSRKKIRKDGQNRFSTESAR